MKLGIIGKPQSGKTTIFNAASGLEEAVGDFSQASHRAMIKVPDERIEAISELVNPLKKTYAEIDFLDSPGFTGKGKDSGKFEINPEIKLMDALVVVVDKFSEPTDDLSGQIEALMDEMLLSDMAILESNITKKEKKIRVTGSKEEVAEIELLKKCYQSLEDNIPLLEMDLEDSQQKILKGFTFLTLKPLLIVINISEDDIPNTKTIIENHSKFMADGKRDVIAICGKIEAELSTMSGEDQEMFMEELGIKEPAVDLLIQKSYSLLGLISYLTAGEPEVRAWTIKRGSNAQKSAGVIHSDIERGFIRAEVTKYDDYMEYKTAAALKSAGKTRLEGKEYIVCDGDVILFRFNV